jgi:hypothetical protein
MDRKRRITKEDIEFQRVVPPGGGTGFLYGSPNITIKTKGLRKGSNKVLLKAHWDWGRKNIQLEIFDLIQKEFLNLDSTKEKIARIINKEDSKWNFLEGDEEFKNKE